MSYIRCDGGSGGNTPFDNWPDLSDGTALTIMQNGDSTYRLKNITKNKAKKIGTDVYIELAGQLNITSTVSGFSYYMLTSGTIPNVTQTIGKNADSWYSFPRSSNFLTLCLSDSKGIEVLVYNSGSITTNIDVKIILHDQ